jgi:dTDP-4-amino-4,6-dideoxygalactose transaminase
MSWPKYSSKILLGVNNIIKSGKVNYWTGKYGRIFEEKFAEYIGLKYCVAVNSGSMALELAIQALQLEPKSEILVPARSYIATASSILRAGHIPVFVDVDINSNISSVDVSHKITKKTKAIIVVHLGGIPADILSLKKYKLPIIEDCSQAHGSRIKDKKVGTFGDLAVWSFCTDKTISTLGEGGMIGTNNKKLFERAWSSKDVGRDYKKSYTTYTTPGYKWIHDHLGTNARMTEIQAYAGIEQLKELDNFIEIRNSNVQYYRKILEDAVTFPLVQSTDYVSYWKLNLLSYRRKQILEQCDFCSTGSCSELYKEKVFKSNISLPMAQYFNKNSFALLIDPTILVQNIKKKGKKILEICQKY